MNLNTLIGKTIKSATQMKHPTFDDDGWLLLKFTDGTECLITASYSGYTGESEDEYPTRIGVTDTTLESVDLIPV
jgi:hypothetical protein